MTQPDNSENDGRVRIGDASGTGTKETEEKRAIIEANVKVLANRLLFVQPPVGEELNSDEEYAVQVKESMNFQGRIFTTVMIYYDTATGKITFPKITGDGVVSRINTLMSWRRENKDNVQDYCYIYLADPTGGPGKTAVTQAVMNEFDPDEQAATNSSQDSGSSQKPGLVLPQRLDLTLWRLS